MVLDPVHTYVPILLGSAADPDSVTPSPGAYSAAHKLSEDTQYRPLVVSHSLVPQVQSTTFKVDPSAVVQSAASVNDKENTKKSIKVLLQFPMLFLTTCFSSNFAEEVRILSIPVRIRMNGIADSERSNFGTAFCVRDIFLEPCVMINIKITMPTTVVDVGMIFLKDKSRLLFGETLVVSKCACFF